MIRDPGAHDPRSLMPHGEDACWITRVLGVEDEQITCEGVIPNNSPFALDGECPAFAGLELAAQASAVLEALRAVDRSTRSGPPVGYLVRVRRVRMHRATIPAGRPIEARVSREQSAGPLTTYTVSVAVAGNEVLSGSIGTYVEDAPEGR